MSEENRADGSLASLTHRRTMDSWATLTIDGLAHQ
jgi:hypothetical protein